VASPVEASSILTFWSTYGSIITDGAIIVSAFAALTIILTNRNIARRRGTLDLILHIESDGELIEARNEFINLKKSEKRSANWGTEAQRESPEAKNIRTTLNINELVAVSIKEGVIDETVFRRWLNGAYIDDWKSMTGYIKEVRKYKDNPKIYIELEELAERWEDDKSWNSPPSWIKRKFSALAKVHKS